MKVGFFSHCRFLFLAFTWALLMQCPVGCNNRPSAMHEEKIRSGDWQMRHRLAEELAKDHSRQGFKALLQLLGDPHADVRYAAAEALEARADKEYAQELMKAVPKLSSEHQWPAYRALRNYPSIETLRFLLFALTNELERHRDLGMFDDRNCHYIAQSIEQIAAKIPALTLPIKAPAEGSRKAFSQFVVEAEAVLSGVPASEYTN